MSAAELLIVITIVLTWLTACCGSTRSATGPLRHHAEWLGAVTGGSAVTCTAYLLYLIATGKT